MRRCCLGKCHVLTSVSDHSSVIIEKLIASLSPNHPKCGASALSQGRKDKPLTDWGVVPQARLQGGLWLPWVRALLSLYP